MTTPTEKTCPGCKACKAADQFNSNKSRPDGLQRFCRQCQKDLKAGWQQRNLEKTRQYDRDRKLARRSGTALSSPPVPAASERHSGGGGKREEEVLEVKATLVSTSTDVAAQSESLSSGFAERNEEDAPVQTAGFANLPHAAVVASLTNPRRHFDHDFIKGLAASIREHGLAQPILVRPLPASRLEETSYEPLSPQAAWPLPERRRKHIRPTHEIVAGEQRWRACELAGVRFIPALIRELTDQQVLELQLIENLKRRDLHPMEEAEGYERLRETMGLTADDIADRIDKGRSYVYNTLKLLDLVPDARAAFYDGKLTRSTAELVAKRPAGLQLQVLKDITATDFHGEPMSFRKAKEHVDSNYMLKLGTAVFKITDETLVPEAGSCRVCPKRSGANPQLFDDVAHADTCTDPTCFNVKKEAHYSRIRIEAEARGQTVITGKEAKEIMPNSTTLRGYTRVDDDQAVDGQMRTLRKVLGDNMPATTLIEDPTTHAMVAVLPTAVVGKLLKEQGIAKAPTVESNEATAKREAAEQFESTWRRAAVVKIDEALQNDGEGGFHAAVLRQVALLLVDGLSASDRKHVCTLLELGQVAPREAIEAHIRDCHEEDVDRALLLLLVQHDVDVHPNGSQTPAATRIEAVAAAYRVDLAAIKAEVKAEARRATSAAKVNAAAAAIVSKPKKAKATAAEAQAQIALQMQTATNPNNFAADQRVRIKTDLRRGTDVFATNGIEADVIRPQGDRAWEVQPANLSFTLFADYTELEAIEP